MLFYMFFSFVSFTFFFLFAVVRVFFCGICMVYVLVLNRGCPLLFLGSLRGCPLFISVHMFSRVSARLSAFFFYFVFRFFFWGGGTYMPQHMSAHAGVVPLHGHIYIHI